ncbi:MAG: QueT transporter family protein, partial [Acetatifactor sp.]|nr:QueT transporter family protein [Acetatifactor sp.]
MKNSKALFVAQAALIAALYVVLTLLANSLGLANYAIQLRFSEALTILPFFTPAAIPGLFLGCLISNLLTGAIVWDVVFGSIATLAGAIGTYMLRRCKWMAPVPPVVA